MISQKPPGAEARAGRFPGPSLIPDLHRIQREHGWLPREELVTLSRDRRLLYEIEGLISFYPHFRTSPPPAREVACCHDLACWLHGSDERRAALLEKTMRLTSICGLGQVALGPAISVLGLKRGGTEARPQPRPPRAPDQATPDSSPASPDAGSPDGDSS